MSPLERLLAEELPTGTFGGAIERTGGEASRDRAPVAPGRAAANRRALEEALARPSAPSRPRLRLIVDDTKDAA